MPTFPDVDVCASNRNEVSITIIDFETPIWFAASPTPFEVLSIVSNILSTNSIRESSNTVIGSVFFLKIGWKQLYMGKIAISLSKIYYKGKNNENVT
jgi:hypothetical protein